MCPVFNPRHPLSAVAIGALEIRYVAKVDRMLEGPASFVAVGALEA
jgi:hypothetical protein